MFPILKLRVKIWGFGNVAWIIFGTVFEYSSSGAGVKLLMSVTVSTVWG